MERERERDRKIERERKEEERKEGKKKKKQTKKNQVLGEKRKHAQNQLLFTFHLQSLFFIILQLILKLLISL